MRDKRLTIQINKPVLTVYDYYTNPKNTPHWIPSIVVEQTNEWPIKLGTVYKNQNKSGVWMEYTVTRLDPGKLFELTSGDKNYHVRYTHKPIGNNSSELEYYEWVNNGELEDPFTQDTLEKLKSILER